MFNGAPLTRAQHLADEIELTIQREGLRAGDRLATMDELRERTKLARSTISEAARLLTERGTVEVKPGRGGGLFVAESDPVVRMRHTLLSVPNGATTVSDAIAVREALEELVDVDAARHRSIADSAELGKALARMRRAVPRPAEFLRRNWELHERIATITPNSLARGVYLGTLRCIAELPSQVDTAAEDEKSKREYLQDRLLIHTELVDAIVAGDVERTIAAVRVHRGSSRS